MTEWPPHNNSEFCQQLRRWDDLHHQLFFHQVVCFHDICFYICVKQPYSFLYLTNAVLLFNRIVILEFIIEGFLYFTKGTSIAIINIDCVSQVMLFDQSTENFVSWILFYGISWTLVINTTFMIFLLILIFFATNVIILIIVTFFTVCRIYNVA